MATTLQKPLEGVEWHGTLFKPPEPGMATPADQRVWEVLSSSDTKPLKSKDEISSFYGITVLMAAGLTGKVQFVESLFEQSFSHLNSLTKDNRGFNFLHFTALNGDTIYSRVLGMVKRILGVDLCSEESCLGHTHKDIRDLIEGEYGACKQLLIGDKVSLEEGKEAESKTNDILSKEDIEKMTGLPYSPGLRMSPNAILSGYETVMNWKEGGKGDFSRNEVANYREKGYNIDLLRFFGYRPLNFAVFLDPNKLVRFKESPPTLGITKEGGVVSVWAKDPIGEREVVCPYEGVGTLIEAGIPNVLVLPHPKGYLMVLSLRRIEPRERLTQSSVLEDGRTWVVTKGALESARKNCPPDLMKKMLTPGRNCTEYDGISCGYLARVPMLLAACFAQKIYDKEMEKFYINAVTQALSEKEKTSKFFRIIDIDKHCQELRSCHETLSEFLSYIHSNNEEVQGHFRSWLKEWTSKYSQEVLFAYLPMIPSVLYDLFQSGESPDHANEHVHAVLTFVYKIGVLVRGDARSSLFFKKREVEGSLNMEIPEIPSHLSLREAKFLRNCLTKHLELMRGDLQTVHPDWKKEYGSRMVKLVSLEKSLPA